MLCSLSPYDEHPGYYIKEKLKNRYVKPKVLAKLTQIPLSRIEELMDEKGELTLYEAVKLACFFDTTVEYWVLAQAKFTDQEYKVLNKICDESPCGPRERFEAFWDKVVRDEKRHQISTNRENAQLLKGEKKWLYDESIIDEISVSLSELLSLMSELKVRPLIPARLEELDDDSK